MKKHVETIGWVAPLLLAAVMGCSSRDDEDRGAWNPPSSPTAAEATITEPPPSPGEVFVSTQKGVAPLAVYFDAAPKAGPGESHAVKYRWEFGDPGSGSWKHSGLSKDKATGALAAHVYETPGIYKATVTIEEPTKASRKVEVTLHVEDPEIVYAGPNTICVSTTGDFSGAPPGARFLTTSSFPEALSYVSSGTRILFRRGQEWIGDGKARLASKITLGAYGKGGNTRIVAGRDGWMLFLDGSVEMSDWRIMDLNFDGGKYPEARGILFYGILSKVLCLRASFTSLTQSIRMEENMGYQQLSRGALKDMAVVDCEMVQPKDAGWGCRLVAERLVFLGNFCSGDQINAPIQIPMAMGGVIGHSLLFSEGRGRQLLNLYAPGKGATKAGEWGRKTERVIVSDNIFHGSPATLMAAVQSSSQNSPGGALVGIGPNPGTEDQELSDILVERNHFQLGGNAVALNISGSQMTVRNNLFQSRNSVNPTFVLVSQAGSAPSPRGISIQNNTAHSAMDPRLTLVGLSGILLDVSIQNNLISGFRAESLVVSSGTAATIVGSNNLAWYEGGFVHPTPVAPADFRLAAGHPAIDAGATLPGVFEDYEGKPRPPAKVDIGAFER